MEKLLESTPKKRKVRNTAAKGARLERLAISMLEEYGHYCMRSAASKGFFDILATKNNYCLAIQVKCNKKPSKDEFLRIIKADLPNNFFKQIWIFYDGKPKEPEIIWIEEENQESIKNSFMIQTS